MTHLDRVIHRQVGQGPERRLPRTGREPPLDSVLQAQLVLGRTRLRKSEEGRNTDVTVGDQ